ncbi:MAG: phasin family protein, partial [Betaproteobacteria bacterium]|nr:phasin family protein [Betaproteobacteria bacterium]
MNNLNSVSEQFGDMSKAALDVATKFASVSFDTTERALALNLEAVKVSFDHSTQN